MSLLWLVPVLPLVGAFVLAVAGGRMPKPLAGAVGCASVGLSWLAAVGVAASYLTAPPDRGVFIQSIGRWIDSGPLHVRFAFFLDAASLVMIGVVTFVAFIIHLYSFEYMSEEDGYSRFFAYMNLFVASMLVLVLADNLLLLYLGWEGVGLCSYLLIGFWYGDRVNGVAAQKAFIVTRIGDTSLAVGLFFIFWKAGTLNIAQAMGRLTAPGPGVGTVAAIAALLVLGGALAKSAQLPLQTWLPDAMAGPTPVSALIHAATMVAAGVYLIARLHLLFLAAPAVMTLVAAIGAATALYASLSALVQRDIKRVLAYSTISQIGYMFLALGVGAWEAAIFHFMTHAFFKALLFLSAGIVVRALGEEHDIYNMGGLARRLPTAYWTFLAGAASLSALPLVTAGFYSKDAILTASFASRLGSPVLWLVGILTAILTGIYIFRVFFVVFFGPQRKAVEKTPGPLASASLAVLSFFAVVGGFVGIPRILGGYDPFGRLLVRTFGVPQPVAAATEVALLVVSSLASVAGIVLGYLFFMRLANWKPRFAESTLYHGVRDFFFAGWGIDWLYDRLFVRPYVYLTTLNHRDVVDAIYTGVAMAAVAGNRAASATQSGRLRNYATALAFGAVLIAVVVLLIR